MNHVIRPMCPSDLAYVVPEHRYHFPHGFFARLGPRFLSAYTRTYIGAPDARAYVAEVDGKVCGFLVGITDPVAHRRHVLRVHGGRMVGQGALALSGRPRLAWWFLRARSHRYVRKFVRSRVSTTPPEESAVTEAKTAVLAHVVVSRHERSVGLGAALVRRFTTDAAEAGCGRVFLVTETDENGAEPLYQRLGWSRTGESITADGRHLEHYEIFLSKR